MPGDSDKDFFARDQEARDDVEAGIPTSPQDLLQELQRARQQQAQSRAGGSPQNGSRQPWSEDDVVEDEAARGGG